MARKARANGEGSIYPRSKGGFAAYVWVTTPLGVSKRKYVYGQDRDEVHEKWINLQKEALDGPVVTKAPKVGAYLDYWLREVVKPNRAPTTYANYETYIRLHIGPELGPKGLRFTVQQGQAWMNKVARTCQCCSQGKDAARASAKQRCCAIGECCKQTLSVRTLGDIRDCLRSALSDAIDAGLLTKNVAKSIKLPPKRKRRRPRWTTDEAHKFLESARKDRDPLYAAYVLVIVMALRRGEVLGLPVNGVDFAGEELLVDHQLQRVSRKLLHRQTKTEASEDTLPMIDVVVTALRLRLAQREEDRTAPEASWRESGLVFTTRHGTPIEPRNFLRSWSARCAKAGVRRITIHDGRRTCGSLLADLDVHPRVAMRILRHAQFAVTMEIYTEVSDESTRAALRRLGESLDF